MTSHKKLFVERVQNYVGGQWKASANPEYVTVTNPATGEPLGLRAHGDGHATSTTPSRPRRPPSRRGASCRRRRARGTSSTCAT